MDRPDRPVKKARKACTECRQQKARCDAYLTPGEPCSRCRRLRLQCIISDPFKREHKRKRLSDLEKEAALLRRRLKHTASLSENGISPARHLTQSPSDFDHASSAKITPNAPDSQLPIAVSAGPSLSAVNSVRIANTTSPRELDGVALTSAVIDELFRNFSTTFQKFLPIVDASGPPDLCYAESAFLFWAIIGVGARTYRDQHILRSLAPKIINLACTSLQYTQKQSTIPIIKAFLLLVTWPFPRDTHATEVWFPFSGTLIHMALQIGLHIPAASQDFAREKVKLTQEDINSRYELWAYCVLAYHRVCVQIGQHPALILHAGRDQDSVISRRTSPNIKFRLSLLQLESRCCAEMEELSLAKLSAEKEKTLDMLIRVFEAQIKDLESQVTSENDRFHYNVAFHMVNVMHFYKASLPTEVVAATRVYTTACAVIDQLQCFDFEPLILAACPIFHTYCLLLSCSSIIRLLKSSFRHHMDVKNAESKILLGLDTAKKMSIGNGDIASKVIPVITQLWNSERAFKKPDGSEFIVLRIRTRMMVSPVYDALWWWREEFGGQAGAYPPSADDDQTKITEKSTTEQPIEATTTDPSSIWFGFMEPYSFPNDTTFAEFGWPTEYDMHDPLGDATASGWMS